MEIISKKKISYWNRVKNLVFYQSYYSIEAKSRYKWNLYQKEQSKLSDEKKDKNTNNGLWDWVKAICSITIVFVVSYKVYLTPIVLTVDFPTLLSLLLAMFSVAIAALFYFKATDTSNTFYDNTYKFTKDIAELLVKIESGFGEKLRNLDEGYTSMRDSLKDYGGNASDSVKETRKKIESEKSEMEKVVQERNIIISELIDKANLQVDDKADITQKLKEKEFELQAVQNELSHMNKRLLLNGMDRDERKQITRGIIHRTDDPKHSALNYTRRKVLNRIGIDVIMEAPKTLVIRKFNDISADLPIRYLEDLHRDGYYEDGLTVKGYNMLKQIANREDSLPL